MKAIFPRRVSRVPCPYDVALMIIAPERMEALFMGQKKIKRPNWADKRGGTMDTMLGGHPPGRGFTRDSCRRRAAGTPPVFS